MGSPALECESSFEPKCPAADHMLARLPGALPMVFLGADDYTGSRLSAILPVLVLGFVSTTGPPVKQHPPIGFHDSKDRAAGQCGMPKRAMGRVSQP